MSQSSIVKPQYLNTISPDWCPYISLQNYLREIWQKIKVFFLWWLFYWFSLAFLLIINWSAVILLQIVIVSPGTHFVKNDESQSRTSESQLKNAWAFMQPDS